MKTAIAISGDTLSRTLGTADKFVLLTETSEEHFLCTGKIPAFLKEHNVRILICNGIGNCMLDLLYSMGIQVIPGVEGDWKDIAERFRTGHLTAGEKYSCTDHGQSCGACAGTF